MKRLLITLSVLVIALATTACGSGDRDFTAIATCLKKANLTVEESTQKSDPNVEKGVTGVTGLDGSRFTIAVAALVSNAEKVKEFETKTKAFTDSLTANDKQRLTVKSGTSNRYVWVVAGDEKADTFNAALKCVK